ncbi:MAG: YfiR family protein [Burkholderiales bacterium]|nr:YfiR family protein [Burkholderiales bacterium]
MLYLLRSAAALAAAALACAAGHAQPRHAPENQLKAALIYNFALFTAWPAGVLPEGEALTLCVLKNTEVTEALSQLEQKAVAGHVLRLKLIADNETWQSCKLAYLEEDEHARLAQLRKKLEGLSVLTISDRPAAVNEGIMIGISMENNRFVFDINANAAHLARLSISSKLLRLARKVVQ